MNIKSVLAIWGTVAMLCLGSIVMGQSEGCYITIKFLEYDTSGELLFTGTSGWNCDNQPATNGVYYKAGSVSGIKGGAYADEAGISFEMPYSLRLLKLPQRLILEGVVFAIFQNGANDIISGRKIVIHQEIEYEDEFLIEVNDRDGSKFLTIGIILQDKKPKRTRSQFPVSLKTSFTKDGEPKGQATNSRGALTDSIKFQTGFSIQRDDGYFEQVKHQMEIIFASLPENISEPFRTKLTFRRTYNIDTLHYPQKEFVADVIYRSEFTKEIELVPGKTLMLVFPPDSPSVRGFNIEDTLYIRP